jgi:hypothetical protein
MNVDKIKVFESSNDDYFRTCSCEFNKIEIKFNGWLKDDIESS